MESLNLGFDIDVLNPQYTGKVFPISYNPAAGFQHGDFELFIFYTFASSTLSNELKC